MTLAAFELQNGDGKIIDIALKYSYDSPVSFARAFQKLHGVTPTAAREPGAKLKAYPRLTFHISLRGDKELNYKVFEKPAFSVIGKCRRFTTANGENLKLIPEFWREIVNDGTCSKLMEIAAAKEGGELGGNILGICMEGDEFSYVIGVETDSKTTHDEFTSFIVPARGVYLKWLVPCRRPYRRFLEEYMLSFSRQAPMIEPQGRILKCTTRGI
ncbi:MAG: regulatory protein soxS [Firmicutes bacterium]|nr:regulatory protein soxS [Bacillota bacterium]